MARVVLVLFCRAALSAATGATPTLRQALLGEATHRLNDWFLNEAWTGKPPKGRIDFPHEQDGIQLQITTGNYLCDADERIDPFEKIQLDPDEQPSSPDAVPITFGRFDVEDADAIDVFNVLADTKAQEEWDDLIHGGPGVTMLGDFPDEFARGVAMTFVAHPFPDRQVFQWEVYNSSKKHDDMWVVFSTRQNEELHKLRASEAWPAVQAQNCLGAYHVVALPQGGCHVVFTTQVNSHPPWPITAKFVFNMLWTKTVGYIQQVRKRAQMLKKQRLAAHSQAAVVIPDWLLYDGKRPNKTAAGKLWVDNAPKTEPPFGGPDYLSDIIQTDSGLSHPVLVANNVHLPMLMFASSVFLVMGLAATWKRLRRGAAAEAMAFDTLAQQEDGTAPPLLSTEA